MEGRAGSHARPIPMRPHIAGWFVTRSGPVPSRSRSTFADPRKSVSTTADHARVAYGVRLRDIRRDPGLLQTMSYATAVLSTAIDFFQPQLRLRHSVSAMTGTLPAPVQDPGRPSDRPGSVDVANDNQLSTLPTIASDAAMLIEVGHPN